MVPSPPRRFSFRRFVAVYHIHMPGDPRRERLFLASLAFLLTFGFIRGLTFSIRNNIGPFRNVSVGGTHLHHLVWGILLLLVVGYASLIEFSTRGSLSNFLTRITAIGFGVGAALTLDEFALWLNLQDVYWERQGRESIDAVAIFGGLLLVGVFGRDLLKGLVFEFRAAVRGATWAERTAEGELERIESGGAPESPEEPVDRST